ncbi:MAG: hypothetical protein EBS47_11070 [Betaproteobacteria bacterium]|nr:hypothetical protein [Betaproteobacteria bacterium]
MLLLPTSVASRVSGFVGVKNAGLGKLVVATMLVAGAALKLPALKPSAKFANTIWFRSNTYLPPNFQPLRSQLAL